jgi:alkylated DNA repair protein (DNA oxidative demethylase)
LTLDLFERFTEAGPAREDIADGAVLLRGLACPIEAELVIALKNITNQAPFRHMMTPGGHRMSVAMTNCGSLGWVTDRLGYRYGACDPESSRPWPAMPDCFRELAGQAAERAGFDAFAPDACLINSYQPGARMSLHQDKDEDDGRAPIVSVSLGLSAIFLFGGSKRSDKPHRFRLQHGDVVVWGGPARFAYHGVAPIADGDHALLGRQRINLTFRKAGWIADNSSMRHQRRHRERFEHAAGGAAENEFP